MDPARRSMSLPSCNSMLRLDSTFPIIQSTQQDPTWLVSRCPWLLVPEQPFSQKQLCPKECCTTQPLALWCMDLMQRHLSLRRSRFRPVQTSSSQTLRKTFSRMRRLKETITGLLCPTLPMCPWAVPSIRRHGFSRPRATGT